MFSAIHTPSARRGQLFAGTYQQVGAQTMVAAASAHQLVALLFEGFVAAVNRARGALRDGDVAAKCGAIRSATCIVQEGLRGGLNLQAGGRLAVDLADLYAYIGLRLTQANLHGDEAALDECLRLMQPLREAWTEIGTQVGRASARN